MTRWVAGSASLAGSGAMLGVAMSDARHTEFVVVLGVVAVLVLAGALVAWPRLLSIAAVALVGAYGMSLVGAPRSSAPVWIATLVVFVLETAAWSNAARSRAVEPRDLVAERLVRLATEGLAAGGIAALVLAVSRAEGPRGTAPLLIGAAGAVGLVALTVHSIGLRARGAATGEIGQVRSNPRSS